MGYQQLFRRHEIKYLITPAQQQWLLEVLSSRLEGDRYGRSTICNVYFDTPDSRLIRRSLEKPVYKEKLRLRSYGTASPDSTVFVELKKKYKGVVYKRRVPMCEAEAMDYLCRRQPAEDGQIQREIDYFMDFYGCLQPAMHLSYERQAYYDRQDSGFRLTFDDHIVWRRQPLSLCVPPGGQPLLPDDRILMEVKTTGALPLWLTDLLTRQRIFRTPFSKYGLAYEAALTNKNSGGVLYVG